MSAHAVSKPQLHAEKSTRSIVLRTRGHQHGGITRLVSPGDIAELIIAPGYFNAGTVAQLYNAMTGNL